MLKASKKSFFIVFAYAPVYAILKLLTSLISATAKTLSILFLQKLLDEAEFLQEEHSAVMVITYCMGMLLALIVAALCDGYWSSCFKIGMERQLNERLVPQILDKYMRIDYTYYENSQFYDTLMRMSKKPEERILNLYFTVMAAVRQIFTIFGIMCVFIQADILVAISFAALFAPLVYLNFKTADMMNEIYNEQSEQQRKLLYLEELMMQRNSLLELRVFRGAGYLLKKWHVLAKAVLSQRIKVKVKAHHYYLLGNLLIILWLIMILIILCRNVLAGSLSLSVFAVLLTSISTALDEEDALYMSLQQIRWQAQIVSQYDIFMTLSEREQNGKEIDVMRPVIEFENVSFSYPGHEKMILNNISFQIQYGEHIALVGANGAGKSTIMKLLCRLYRPVSGRILINGVDIWEMSENTFQKIFSVVFQDYCKYSLTLRENVALGNLERIADDIAINKALWAAKADHIARPDELLGKLGDNGRELSGGQWQRVAIARAFFADNPFVILDEPTAALDPIAESAMYENILNVLKERSCIFCSHRLASARLADRVLVIADGKLVEDGSHEELMRQKRYYAKMYEMQSAWYTQEAGGWVHEKPN